MADYTLRLNTAEVLRRITDGLEAGVKDAAEHVLEISSRKVPIEEGTLSSSGVVTTDGARAAISYDTEYAVIQHEALDFQHDAGREAKYLENAGNEARSDLPAIVAGRIRKELG